MANVAHETQIHDIRTREYTIMKELIQLAAATAGSLGFAALFNIQGRKLVYATLGGFLAWAVYLAVSYFSTNPYLCGFLSSVMFTLYAECMARLQKTPVTVFLVSGAIPLIPGASLYYAMSSLMRQDWSAFAGYGSYTLLFAASMSAGITTTTIIFQIIWEQLQ